jgi:hypothetical protein
MNYELLLDQAKSGTITARDIDHVAHALQTNEPDADRYTLLHIIGRSNAIRHRVLVEKYLTDDDPMLVRLALQILCSYWGESSRYIEKIRMFASGNPRDPDDDVRLVALSIAGEYLRGHEDSDLARIVLRSFQDVEQGRNVREVAYRSICRAVGLEWHDIPASTRHFDLNREVRSDVLNRFKRRFEIGD